MTTRETLEQELATVEARAVELSPEIERRSKLDAIDEADDTQLSKDIDEAAGLIVKRDELRSAIADMDRRAEVVAKLRTIHPVVAANPVQPEMRTARDVWFMRDSEVREAALPMLEDRNAFGHLSTSQIDALNSEVRRGQLVARRLVLTETDEYRDAFMQAISNPNMLVDDQKRALREEHELRAFAEGATTTGGYGVPVAIDPSIILTDQETDNPFLSLATSINVNTNVWKGVTSAGMSWSFDTEAEEVSDDTTTLGQPEITIFMAKGFLPYSIEVEQDYAGFASELGRLLSVGYDELLVEAFTTGAGTTAPRGILTALDANTNVEVVTTSDGVFQIADIRKVFSALPQKYRRRATWMMNEEVISLTQAFGTDDLSTQTIDLSGELIPRLKGKPVAENAYFPDYTTTTGAMNIAVVGDFSNYYIARRAGMVVEQVQHLFGTTNNRPTGQRGLFGWARIGANSVNDVAFRLLQNQ